MRMIVFPLVLFFLVASCDEDKKKQSSSRVSRSEQKLIQAHLSMLSQAIDIYYVSVGEWPDSLDDLLHPKDGSSPVVKKLPEDPWGESYTYKRTEEGFEVSCKGPDKVPDTEDDIKLNE